MYKGINITTKTILAVIFIVTGILLLSYINDIKSQLTSANEEIKKINDVKLNQTKQIDELVGKLEVSIKENVELKEENIELKDANDKSTKQITSLENEVKQLKEKVYPTRNINFKTKGTPVNITMTFYGDFAHENGGYAGIDANGNKLVAGTVASNYYPQGTQFEYNGQIFTVRDRGGSAFNSANHLDVFVPRLKNESNSNYSKRIREYGIRKVVMYKR